MQALLKGHTVESPARQLKRNQWFIEDDRLFLFVPSPLMSE